jgi:hypothetical protein
MSHEFVKYTISHYTQLAEAFRPCLPMRYIPPDSFQSCRCIEVAIPVSQLDRHALHRHSQISSKCRYLHDTSTVDPGVCSASAQSYLHHTTPHHAYLKYYPAKIHVSLSSRTGCPNPFAKDSRSRSKVEKTLGPAWLF